jgi:hypothetical protein
MAGEAEPLSKQTLEPVSETKASGAAAEKGTIAGTVSYPWGIVKGAKVFVGEKTVLSNNEGKYEASLLDPGPYSVTAEAPFPGYEAAPQRVELLAGEIKTVDILLDFKKTIVDGHVYDRDGKPIAYALLSGVLSGKDMEKATTDENGFFRFDKVTPGDRFIRINAKGFMGQTLDFTAKEGVTTSLEFKLQPSSCVVQGTVKDSDGKPMMAEVLLLTKGIVNQKTMSDTNTGHFEFYILPGFYEILAVAPYYRTKGWSGNISAEQRVDLTLERIPEGYTPPR